MVNPRKSNEACSAFTSSLFSSFSPNISNNMLDGGTGSDWSGGIYNYYFSSPTITNNTIYGGNSIGITVGIADDGINSSSTIRNNTIDGGSGSVKTYGISFRYENANLRIM